MSKPLIVDGEFQGMIDDETKEEEKTKPKLTDIMSAEEAEKWEEAWKR